MVVTSVNSVSFFYSIFLWQNPVLHRGKRKQWVHFLRLWSVLTELFIVDLFTVLCGYPLGWINQSSFKSSMVVVPGGGWVGRWGGREGGVVVAEVDGCRPRVGEDASRWGWGEEGGAISWECAGAPVGVGEQSLSIFPWYWVFSFVLCFNFLIFVGG